MSGARLKVKLRPARPRPCPRAKAAETARPTGPGVPNRAAQQLALAHFVEGLIEDGLLAGSADAARRLGLTRARLTQVANLLLLSPEIQERVLTGDLMATERSLRTAAGEPEWQKQVAMCNGKSE